LFTNNAGPLTVRYTFHLGDNTAVPGNHDYGRHGDATTRGWRLNLGHVCLEPPISCSHAPPSIILGRAISRSTALLPQ